MNIFFHSLYLLGVILGQVVQAQEISYQRHIYIYPFKAATSEYRNQLRPASLDSSRIRKVFALRFGGGLKFFFTRPAGFWYDSHPVYEPSGAMMVSAEMILNQGQNHMLGIDGVVFRSGYKYNRIVYETHYYISAGYRFSVPLSKKVSLSGKIGYNFLSYEMKYWLTTSESIFIDYIQGGLIYFVEYKTDIITNSPNFLLLGVGVNL